MRIMGTILITLAILFAGCGESDDSPTITPDPEEEIKWQISPASTRLSSGGDTESIIVEANGNWSVASDQPWCNIDPGSGGNGQTVVKITATKNSTEEARSAELTFISGKYNHKYNVVQDAGELIVEWTVEPYISDISFEGGTKSISVNSNADWELTANQSWITLSSDNGSKGETVVKITATANTDVKNRIAELKFVSGNFSKTHFVNQEADKNENYVPEEYSMVWNEEFDVERQSDGKPSLPDTDKWFYETAEPGWVNNELQTYIEGYTGTDTVAAIHDGTLKIKAIPVDDRIYSARINSIEAWTYGYFEARLRVPGGKGTWPAFWMMPKNFTAWPLDGEIDIMEYVGYDPNVVHSSIHTQSYYHSIGTQKTGTKKIENAEIEFHVYAVEWTAEYIKGFVDGVEYFRFDNDGTGNKHTWPFNAPFYLKLNLAWGGDWGAAQGIDESALPATYEIDYVRVYQK